MSGWNTASAPATVANLGPGFDVLGLALDPAMGLADTCSVRVAAHDRLELTIAGDGGRLPIDPARNVVGVAAQAVLDAAGASCGLEIRLEKGLPLCSGLGSSAASAASAALATNAALGQPLSLRQLIPAGRAGEALAAGFPHPDNVVPSLLGGLLLMVDDDVAGLAIARLPVPDFLRVAIVIPDLEVATAAARAAIPARIPVADAVANMGRLALLVSSLYEGDRVRMRLGIQDRLHQPYRIPLVRGFDAARDAALAAGALGVGLSGSGPAMFALADSDATAEACAEAFVGAFCGLGIDARGVSGRVAPPQD